MKCYELILILIIIILFILINNNIDNLFLPPPALKPGATYFPNYVGDYCDKEQQELMKECQTVYSDCIDSSIKGEAHFPDCHKEFMENCMPVINDCQTE